MLQVETKSLYNKYIRTVSYSIIKSYTVDFRVFESWSWERVLVSCNMRQSGEHPLRLAESTLHENIEGQSANAIVQT